MNARGRGAVKLVAIAYAAAAALVFVQTFALQAISYDSSAFGPVVTLFRLAFFATDVAIFVALVRLAGGHLPVKPFAATGVGIGVFSVASGAFGLLSRALGTPTRSERMFENFAKTMSAAEPAVGLGIAILVIAALAAIARAKDSESKSHAAWYVFMVATATWFLVTMMRATSREAQSISVAWIAWALEIAKPLSIAACAWVLHRAFRGTPIGDDAPKVGPYREGEAAPPPSGEAELPPPDPATIEPLRHAASGVRLYSTAFALRLAGAFVLTILTLAASGSDDLWIVFLLLPAAGTATAIAMAVGLGRQRALPSMRAGGRVVLAMVALGIAAASDGLFSLVILLTGITSSGWSAHRKAQTCWGLAYPSSALFVGISVLLVAGALARTGETLARAALMRRARWAQSLAIATFAFTLGLFFSVGAINGHDHDQKNGGALVSGLLSLAALGVIIAFIVMHILTQAEAARTLRARLAGALVVVLALLVAPRAEAFCGFYVGGAGAKLFNDATVVVMMREGTRTVLSMQNAYKGPPEKFAMVVPVPIVLQEENVKTLKRELFDHVDQLASPRLVEYWEQDPCAPDMGDIGMPMMSSKAMAASEAMAAPPAQDLGVRVEAQFVVGEYQIVILSAQDSGGLDTWLHREGYAIPDGGEPYFRPYVASGSKFFVAKVDVTKVKMENGFAQLSPLRFHYDSEDFRLPVRLGLINSSGTQDLIVHVLGSNTRYEVANYPNVTIPTNLDVSEAASGSFGTFYTTLFDRTLEKHPKAVVTEYAWAPSSCDPCPGPVLDYRDLQELGLDVLQPKTGGGMGMVLTRLHVRYTKESLGEDLVFRTAPAIVGGRETIDADGKLEHGAQKSTYNNFQARYAVRHAWTGPITCKDPKRGKWGGKPGGDGVSSSVAPAKSAQKLGLVARTKSDLATYVRQDIPEIDFKAAGAKKSCLGCATVEREQGIASGGVLALLGGVLLFVRRRRRR